MNHDAGKVEVPFTEDELAALLEVVTPLLPDVDRARLENPHLLMAWLHLADAQHIFKMKALDAEPPRLRLVP